MVSALNNSSRLIANRSINDASRAVKTSLERLATGKRINRASDDPAGAVAVTDIAARQESLKAELKGLEQQSGYLGARDGAQSVISDLLTDLRGIAVQASSRDSYSDDEREGFQIEADSILKTIDYLANTSTFKGQQLISGLNTTTLGRGSAKFTREDGTIGEASVTLADLRRGGKANLINGDFEAALAVTESAASSAAFTRAGVGAETRALDSRMRRISTELEELTGLRSSIEDTDYASETAKLVRAQVLEQASTYAATLAVDQRRSLIENLLKPLKPS